MILSIRTDKPEAEIGLYKESKQVAYEKWHAHRELSATIHHKIEDLLKSQAKDWQDITGIICFAGPGSFTGLRIGLSLANALAQSLNVPVAGAEGENWQQQAIAKLLKAPKAVVLPNYGTEAKTTKPKS